MTDHGKKQQPLTALLAPKPAESFEEVLETTEKLGLRLNGEKVSQMFFLLKREFVNPADALKGEFRRELLCLPRAASSARGFFMLNWEWA